MRAAPIATVALLLLGSSLPGIAEDASRASRPDLDAWTGVWVLDKEASDRIGPLLKLLDAPWIARTLADRLTPTLTITVLGERGLSVVNENRLQTSERMLWADGIERERRDPSGRKVLSKEFWTATGQLVVSDRIPIDDRVVVVTSTWERVGEGLELTIRAGAGDGSLEIRRIFRRRSKKSSR